MHVLPAKQYLRQPALHASDPASLKRARSDNNQQPDKRTLQRLALWPPSSNITGFKKNGR
jgi:hypothetical protein